MWFGSWHVLGLHKGYPIHRILQISHDIYIYIYMAYILQSTVDYHSRGVERPAHLLCPAGNSITFPWRQRQESVGVLKRGKINGQRLSVVCWAPAASSAAGKLGNARINRVRPSEFADRTIRGPPI